MDFRSKPPDQGFSLDHRALAQPRPALRNGREWRSLIMLPIAVVAVVMCVEWFTSYSRGLGDAAKAPVDPPLTLAAMATPDLPRAAELPSAASVAAMVPDVSLDLLNRRSVRRSEALDLSTLAWAEYLLQQDRELPPVPQRLDLRDLVLDEAQAGIPCLVNGTIDDIRTAEDGTGWSTAVLALGEGQYAAAVAMPGTPGLVVGQKSVLVGRYLGLTQLPSATGAVTLPLLAVRAAAEIQEGGILENPYVQNGPWAMPDGIFTDIDDERTVLETRPYYYALGQARFDLGNQPEAPLNGNALANDIHQRPDEFRGKRVTVTGFVYRAWLDEDAAIDKPFGIQRVVRVLFWSRDFGPLTQTVNGKPKTENMRVIRLFEAALPGDAPLPTVGTNIAITGRFLKWRAIPVQVDRAKDLANDVQRSSDRVYTLMVVGTALKEVSPLRRVGFSWLGVVFGAGVVGTVVFFWWVGRRERASIDAVQLKVRALRENRHKKALQPKDAPPPAAS